MTNLFSHVFTYFHGLKSITFHGGGDKILHSLPYYQQKNQYIHRST